MHSYYSPKFNMKLKAQVVYKIIKVKNYTSFITLDIFISSNSLLLDLENNSTPTSQKENVEEKKYSLTLLHGIC